MTTEEIAQYLEYSEELKTLVSDLIRLKTGGQSFRDLCTFAGITEEEQRKIDSSYPSPYASQIRDIYPEFTRGIHCYDYNTATFGAMRNISNDITDRILKRI